MTPKEDRLQKWIQSLGLTTNLSLKAAALGLSFFLWFLFATQEKREMQLDVPLLPVNAPPGLTLAGNIPTEVSVLLRGRRASVQRITPADVSVSVDLSRAREGTFTALLGPENVEAPFGIEVARIIPSQLFLRMDALVTETIPIRAQFQGKVPEGFEVVETILEPSEARVRGPKSLVGRRVSIDTQPIPLAGRKNDFGMPVKPVSTIPGIAVLAPEEVRVEVKIRERRETRTLQVGVELKGEAGGTVQFNPKTLAVTLEGPISKVREIRAEQLLLQVDVEGLQPRSEDYHVPVEAKLRRPREHAGIEVVQQSQQRIDVHVYP